MRFSIVFSSILAAGFALFAAQKAMAERMLAVDLLDPKVSYRADYILRTGNDKVFGKIIHTPNRHRREWTDANGRQVVIVRRDTDAVFIMMPQIKLYLESGFRDIGRHFGDVESLRLDMSARGEEDVAGRPAKRYEATGFSANGGRFAGTLWVSPEGILVKGKGTVGLNGRDQPFETELSNLELGPAEDSLFAPPDNFIRISLGAIVTPDRIPEFMESIRRSRQGR